MKRMTQSGFGFWKIVLITIVAVLFLAGFTAVVNAADTYVPDDYGTIQAAVDNATAGDTIIVRDGTYIENVDVDKSLTIKSENGADSTIVQAANPNDHVFGVTENLVTISGFTVTGATGSPNAGIYVGSADYCTISDNNASYNYYGIYLYYSSNNTISGNDVSNNDGGIFLVYSSNNTISSNDVNGNEFGIYLYRASNNTISGNNVSGNEFGIYLRYSSNNNAISGNNVSNNDGGIFLEKASNNIISGNDVSNNFNGINLYRASNNTISGNDVSGNWFGIYLEYSSSNNAISGNNVSGNRYGIYLRSSSNNNAISGNTFVNDGLFVVSSYHNTVEGNTVNNKPLVYLEDASDYKIEAAGQVILINCRNITVENLDLSNTCVGIELWGTVDSIIADNTVNNNDDGILLCQSSNNTISGNDVSNNDDGILLSSSSNNAIYLNNFMDNTFNAGSSEPTSIWNSPSKLTYTYNGNTYSNYLGNYWDDYIGNDANNDGIGNTPYPIESDNDNYPLMVRFENYEIGEDTIPPTVTSVSPEDGASDVVIDTVVTATFSEAMDSSTITTDNFTLAGSAVSGTVTYDSDTYTATFTPDANLDYNHEYTAALSTDITDKAGNHLVEEYTWSFTMESAPADTTPPAAVIDLAASEATTDSITLTYTAPGDDENLGTASEYDIRYSTSEIIEANWDSANQCAGEPAPQPTGSSEIFIATGLSPDSTYYFALKTADEVPNWSGLSNVAQGATLVQFKPELSIPIYSPQSQTAPQGTKLTYIINVTNEGNVEDIIELTVSKQSISENPEDWWEVQFSSSSVVLAPKKSEDILVNVVIPKNFFDINCITIRGESSSTKNCFAEVKITADGIDEASILFGSKFYFRKSDSEHILIFEVPDFAEISDDQIIPTENVAVVYNPRNSGDLDNTYIKIHDLVDGEETIPPVTLPIKFTQHADEVITTDFDMQIDAYHFSNNVWEDGKCYGMAATSVLYFIGELPLPPDTTTYDLTPTNEMAMKFIDDYSESLLYNNIIATWLELLGNNKLKEDEFFGFGYNDLKECIGNGEPMIFFLGGKGLGAGHAVVAYRIVEDEVSKASYILIYDPNWPYEFNNFLKAFPYIIYDREEEELSPYDGYNKFKLAKAEPCYKQIITFSPVSLSIHDSEGRVTGLVNGEVKNEIPYSLYDEKNKSIRIFFAFDTYQYEVIGTEKGTYGLEITSVENGEATNFIATDIPTAPGAIHQYTIDWEALAWGEKGVTIQIDSDGDGIFEQTFTTGNTFQLPIASFAYSPAHPVVRETITFDASSSYDPDGTITKYKWNFGDGNISDTTEPIITHSYASAGDYSVNLKVTDDDGGFGDYTTTVTVISAEEATRIIIDQLEFSVSIVPAEAPKGVSQKIESVIDKLEQVIDFLGLGKYCDAIGKLDGVIIQIEGAIDQVNEQRCSIKECEGKECICIDDEAANELIKCLEQAKEGAIAIRDLISAEHPECAYMV